MLPPGGCVHTALQVTGLSFVFFFFFSFNQLINPIGCRHELACGFLSRSSFCPSLQIITPLDRQALISPLFPTSSFPPHSSALSRGVFRACDRRRSVRKSWQQGSFPLLLSLPYGTLCPASHPTDMSMLLLLSLPRCSPCPLCCCCSDPPSSHFHSLLCLIHDKLRDFALAC